MSNNSTATQSIVRLDSPQVVPLRAAWIDRILSGMDETAQSTHGLSSLLAVLRNYIGSSRERARWVQEQFWHPRDAQELQRNLLSALDINQYQDALANSDMITLQAYEVALKI